MTSWSAVWKYSVLLVLIFTLAIAVGCGGGGSSSSGNPGGGGTGSGNAPTVTLSADKTTIHANDLVTLTWSSTNAASLSFSPSVGEDSPGPSGTANIAPLTTTTYTLTARNANNVTSSAAVTITVNAAAPTITFTATPAWINAGQTAALTWSTQNATSLTIDNGVGTFSTASGSANVTPLAPTTYTATVTGAGGTASAQATVTVAATGTLGVTLVANPVNVAAGASTTLSWTSQNAVAVSITDLGAVNLNGSASVTPATSKSYTATATDATGAKQTASVAVNVLGGTSGLSTLKHIFLYMQENRSFDNYFGKLGEYRASKGLPADIDAPDFNKVFTDYYGDQVKLFHMPTTCMEVTSPGWNESHFYSHRKSDGSFGMDFWMMSPTDSQGSTVDPHYTRSMGYMDQTDIPYYYELATQFATSDNWHASMMGPTVPNRMYLYTGTSWGWIRPNPDSNHPLYTQKTIFQTLNEAGITWKYYYTSGDVFLSEFDIWNDPASQGRVRNIAEYYRLLADPNADKLLPQVVFLEQVASWQLNEHPDNKWGIQPGAANVKKMIDALMTSTAWATSAFILTYDEGGGLYDHVSPIAQPAPDATPPNFKTSDTGTWDQFTYSGFRTPVVVVSPWVKKNFVSHTPMTSLSVLKLIETRFNVSPLTARDAASNDMTEFFDFTAPAWMTPPPMPAQPWYCDPTKDAVGSPTCQTIINWLGPPTGANTCDLTHVKEVAPGHKIGF